MHILNRDIEFVEEDRECSYFDEEISDIRYRYMYSCDEQSYFQMLQRGWRRFGRMHFVPECKFCNKCVSMRIDVKNFKFSKSQKRVINKNKDTKLFIRQPSITLEHINLYDKYHSIMNAKKNWPFEPIDPNDYLKSYVEGKQEYSKEFLYMRDNKLIGVALVDILGDGISSIYCFYDHDYEEFSIGKYSILAQIKMAQQMNIPYIYLGYWIKDHFSMGYKEQYMPFEILTNRANLNDEPIWRQYEI
jgi:arginyl-tRNA--protein-N-Asp/Glu arginylyltransferase